MEDILNRLTNGNDKFRWQILQEKEKIEMEHTIPKYPLLILTCMDPRIDVHRIFQLNPGDVFILRNAGNQYTEDVLRSILIAIHEYNVRYVVVMGNLDSGIKKVRLNNLRHILSAQTLKKIGRYSTNYHFALQRFFKTFVDEVINVKNQVDRLITGKEILYDIKVIGMLYDPFTGWVFSEEDFKKYSSYEQFMLNYRKLLHRKKMDHIDFLETIESEIVGEVPLEPDIIIEKLEVVDVLEESVEEDGSLNIKKEFRSENELKDLQKILEKNAEVIEKSMNIDSNIRIPKIYIPKIKVRVPKVNIYRKEE
jgi:carbonic anhydrase